MSRRLGWGLEYLCYTEHIKEKVMQIDPQSLIDIGCGDGRLTGVLSESIPRTLGVDVSEKAISLARAFWPKADFRSAPASSIQEKFEIALAVEVLEHIPDSEVTSFIIDARNVIANGGRLLISVPSTNLRLNAKHYRHYTSQSLINQVLTSAPDLELEHCEYIFFEPLWITAIRKTLNNRFLFLENETVNRALWRILWKRRICKETQGHHVVAIFRAPCDGASREA